MLITYYSAFINKICVRFVYKIVIKLSVHNGQGKYVFGNIFSVSVLYIVSVLGSAEKRYEGVMLQ